MFNLTQLHKYRESNRLEAKKAVGGLPNSVWETYSAFANTNGGMILLGVEELPDGSLVAVELDNPEKLVKEFWDIVNNKNKVSRNILFDKHVQIEDIDNKRIVVIEVPRAERTVKPIYLNNNPLSGSYRRNGEGDYRCTEETVRAMFRDNDSKTQDMRVLEKLPLSVFDYDSLRGYRNSMQVTRPGHVWERLEDIEFLSKLGAVDIGEDGERHPTAAGLLMFGFENEILKEYPQYFLDYQENSALHTPRRWTDRFVSSSGEWSGNVFDFFYKAYNKLIQNPKIKIPFKMKDGLHRVEDTPVHKALREALANCLTNADFYGPRGLVIRNNADEIIFENPGSFRVSISEALSGGVSSPRNSVIMKMFSLLDIGERTGSGIQLIYQAWKEQNWNEPKYVEMFEPDRTILTLSVTSDEDVPVNDPVNDLVNDPVNKIQSDILNILKKNNSATYAQIARKVNISEATVKRNLKKLQELKLIKRIGSDKTGHWEVL